MRALISLVALSSAAFAASPLVDRVDTTAFVQLEAPGFPNLTPREQALAYWLAQASIAIDPIIYDQVSRFGLRQKQMLETVVRAKDKVDPAVYGRVLEFAKLFWANTGNHNELTGQKFLPKFTVDELKRALEQAGRKDLSAQVDALRESLFDPDYEPLTTAKTPASGKDIIQSSANNFYSGVSFADLNDFSERFRLNSRVVKEKGKLVEQVYRAGTPDGRVPPGLYAEYLRKANGYLQKASEYASPDQSKVIADLIRYYQTGERKDWIQFGID